MSRANKGRGKGYRRTKNGRYEAYVSEHCHFVSLGTYDSESEAINVVSSYKADRLEEHLNRYNHTLSEGVIYEDNYIAFDNGDVFNLFGEKMHPSVDRNGYLTGLINGHFQQYHILIAKCFVPNPNGYPFVNHDNGIKSDNRADNLYWCTRSENTLHSFRTGLQNNVAGVPVYTIEEKEYMRSHCEDNYRLVAEALNRNPETVRKYLARYRKEKHHD